MAHEEEAVESAVSAALLTLIEHLAETRKPDKRVVRRYANAGVAKLKLTLRSSLPYQEVLYVSLLLTRSALDRWIRTNGPESLTIAVLRFAETLLTLSRDKTLSREQRAVVVAAATTLGDCVSKPRTLAKSLNAARSSVAGVTAAPWSSVLLLSESDTRELANNIQILLNPPPLASLAKLDGVEEPASESTASLLLRAAQEKALPADSTGEQMPVDMSQAKLKINGVILTNFRGISSNMRASFCRGSRPVSALIYGDNGVGKSSLVDGIEFALQGRVGRSQDFNSTFAPVLNNLAVNETATAIVEMSDGTQIQRQLVLGSNGRASAVGDVISAGFRWAPVTLKRSDILRFLESDPLSRGTVFFDYFPGDAERMGTRPEEQIVNLEDRLFSLKVRRQALSIDLSRRLEVPLEKVSTPDALERTLSEDLFDGLGIDEAVAEGKWEVIDSGLRSLIISLRKAMSDYRRTKNRIDRASNILNPKEYERESQQLRATAKEVGTELTTSFLKVTKADYIRSINVLAGETGPVSLDIVIELHNGRRIFPQQVFSEGYRDLLALLFFLAVAHSSTRRGQAKILVLDDVIQSVDAGIRLGLMAYVLERFADWQLIMTVHDGMWYQQLSSLMRRRGHPFVEHRLARWTFDGGPEISSNRPGLLAAVDAALAAEVPALAAAAAGRLLEQVSAEESWRLRISIQRTRGDKYTLGDLWPGLVKSLKRSPLASLMREIDDASELRNLLGAHFNEYAESVSWEEVRNFAINVKTLAQALHCENCDDWLSLAGDTQAVCPCGQILLPLK
ncbi:AAA family ATPase [Actinoplanes missouriensis]|uniref:AAA family ATPase n=1 Tax=Actinoplanes missouriensis TaxID=1866 RepID=UPI0033ECC6EE